MVFVEYSPQEKTVEVCWLTPTRLIRRAPDLRNSAERTRLLGPRSQKCVAIDVVQRCDEGLSRRGTECSWWQPGFVGTSFCAETVEVGEVTEASGCHPQSVSSEIRCCQTLGREVPYSEDISTSRPWARTVEVIGDSRNRWGGLGLDQPGDVAGRNVRSVVRNHFVSAVLVRALLITPAANAAPCRGPSTTVLLCSSWPFSGGFPERDDRSVPVVAPSRDGGIAGVL